MRGIRASDSSQRSVRFGVAAAMSLTLAAGSVMLGPAAPALASCRPAGPAAYVTNLGSNSVSVINNCAQVITPVFVGFGPEGIAVSPGGADAYVANKFDGTLSVIDTASDELAATIAVASSPDGFPAGVAVSPNGSRVYVANNGDHTLAVVDTSNPASATLIATIPLPDAPTWLAVSPDGAKVYIADNSTVEVFDTATGTVTATINVVAQSVAVSPDGSTIYAEDTGNNVTVIDAATDAVLGTIPNPDRVVDGGGATNILTVSPDGGTLYEDDQALNRLRVFDTGTYTKSNSVRVGSFPDSVATSADGAFEYVANFHGGTVSKIKANTGKVVNTIRVGSGPDTVATVPPRPGQARNVWLHGLACLSRRFCLAVGTRAVASGTAGFAETRSRGRWRVTEPAHLPGSTDDALNQVSCRTASDCVAVGTADVRAVARGPAQIVALAELWNGRRWTATQPPVPNGAQGSVLRDVSCGGRRACLAVGYYENAAGATLPLSEQLTGRTWRIERIPGREKAGLLTGISCGVARCAAVGTYSTAQSPILPLSEIWRGARWHVEAMPAPGRPSELAVRGVSCGSSAVCLAAGFLVPASGRRVAEPFTERLANGRWHLLARAAKTPANVALDAISCPASNRCIAVGGAIKAGKQSPFAEAWNGTKWRILRISGPAMPTLSALSHVSCQTADSCLAVGNHGLKALAELWNGARWRILSTPDP